MKALFFIEVPDYGPIEENTIYPWYKKELTADSWGDDLLAEIANKTLNCQVVIVLSGFQVTQSQLSSKIRNRKKLEQAMAYELEEQLSEEIDGLFFAYQATAENKSLLDVIVINRVWFEHLLTQFKQQAIELTAVITDTLLLQTLPHPYVILKKRLGLLLKTPQRCYAIDPENRDFFLLKLKSQLPDTLTVIGANEVLPNSDALVIQLNYEVSDNILKTLTADYHVDRGINLLQGIYKPKLKSDWKWIQWGFIGLLSLLILSSGFRAYQRWQLTQQESYWDQQRQHIFHRHFPAIKRIINPLAQMKSELETLKQAQQQQGHFMAVLAKISSGLSHALAEQKIHLSALDFQNNAFNIRLNAASFALIEQAKAALEQQHLAVTIESESSDKANNQVNATFKITGQSL
jgi:general secretion pathway protein L